jgi:hypothetical protein
MITEIVTLKLKPGKAQAQVVAIDRKTPAIWRANPSRIRKCRLYDGERRRLPAKKPGRGRTGARCGVAAHDQRPLRQRGRDLDRLFGDPDRGPQSGGTDDRGGGDLTGAGHRQS